MFLLMESRLCIVWFVGFVFAVGTVNKIGILRGGPGLFLCVLLMDSESLRFLVCWFCFFEEGCCLVAGKRE